MSTKLLKMNTKSFYPKNFLVFAIIKRDIKSWNIFKKSKGRL